MSPQIVFLTHLILGYVPWLLCFGAYIWPRLRAMDHFDAQRAIAALHSLRLFGLAFLLPGVVGPNLPDGFATFAAYGYFATGALALLALLTIRVRPLFWLLVIAFNLVGVADIAVDFYDAVRVDLPQVAGELGAMYAFPVIYMPLQMITHLAAFYLLVRSRSNAVSSFAGDAPASPARRN
ncbi:hypothetical protein [Mesorhizobium sp. B1-1-5]|uniref:hypothetical protein n=1 Tax=Mesorhizobium sp. B1-1-5 TaxID=2589979 RepID=UPI00112840C9|nr:hypothetical protein [Mesorhizobium sp. B1-1-5]TPO09992.1 hypothetical protein FJ980_09825 [Mesorhizobium sp. B1-1-5]